MFSHQYFYDTITAIDASAVFLQYRAHPLALSLDLKEHSRTSYWGFGRCHWNWLSFFVYLVQFSLFILASRFWQAYIHSIHAYTAPMGKLAMKKKIYYLSTYLSPLSSRQAYNTVHMTLKERNLRPAGREGGPWIFAKGRQAGDFPPSSVLSDTSALAGRTGICADQPRQHCATVL